MRRPRTAWHQEVLDNQVIDTLDNSINTHSDLLEDIASQFSSPSEGEPPEFLAKQIGHWITDRDETNTDFSAPVHEDTDGIEGARMALGYIGVKGWELADIGTVPEN